MQTSDIRPASLVAPALLGAIVGSAFQLQQARLMDTPVYLMGAAAGLALIGVNRWTADRVKPFAVWAGIAILFFAFCGLRSAQFSAQALNPALEGRDIAVTGVVSAMPQRSEIGLRFRFDVESAAVAGEPTAMPPQIYLGWYGGGAAHAAEAADAAAAIPDVQAGERA